MNLTDKEREKLKKAMESWDKPFEPKFRPVPKSVPKKRGRPAKEEKVD